MVCDQCDTELVGRQKKYCSEQCRKDSARALRLRTTFDISPEEYDRILAHQGGGCGICHRPPKPGKRLAVDHEHTAGSAGPVRGLLCFMCNKRILGARSSAIIFATAEYLRNPPAFVALGEERIAPGRPKKKRQPRKRPRNGT